MIHSADKFFMQGGAYNFDPTQLPMAHAECLRGFVADILHRPRPAQVFVMSGLPGCGKSTLALGLRASDPDCVIVDNTNLTATEIAPYMALALAYSHDAQVVRVVEHAETCYRRQVHGVPRAAFDRLVGLERTLSLPPWWKVKRDAEIRKEFGL